MASVLVLGGGGREEAIAWKLSQSGGVSKIFVFPGTGGTGLTNGEKIVRVLDVKLKNQDFLVDWCKNNEISLVVVGPENLLAEGLANKLTAAGIPCFGPTSQAAQIESSKAFMKQLMDKYAIPTAKWKSFNHYQDACEFINNADFPALVVKASGLAAGKGVIVAQDKQEACLAVKDMLESKIFGEAGSTVVVEELLVGEEISCLAFCDGKTLISMPPSQDHKRLLEGDQGPNTGGMGAYCPVSKVPEGVLQEIENNILKKTLLALKNEGITFVGVLYAGIMLTESGPKVLEFNCRFGDPETQVLLPLLKSDLYVIMKCCVDGELNENVVQFEVDKWALGIVLASEGYPGVIKQGRLIKNTEKALELPNSMIFYSGVEPSKSTHQQHSSTSTENNPKLVTSGGRVMTLVVTSNVSLADAAMGANLMAHRVEFEGKQYRKDIGWRSIGGNKCREMETETSSRQPLTYASSGVNIQEGDLFVDAIKPLAQSTNRSGCMSGIGSFGALFDLARINYTDPILVSGTDGVGTKLKIAQSMNKHTTIGIDLVAMCVNDVLCHGAEPLFFLDYFSCGKLVGSIARDVIIGITKGCQISGCALVGGETAEMPGMYQMGDYDLAGFSVGVVERANLLPSTTTPVAEGDVLIGLTSSGLHSNGFSLVRKVLEVSRISLEDEFLSSNAGDGSFKTVGDLLLTPTQIYTPHLLPLMKDGLIKACAHITGGGLPGNLSRVVPEGLVAHLDAFKWRVHPVFGWLRRLGNIEEDEMLKTFNCGLGIVLIVGPSNVDVVMKRLKDKCCGRNMEFNETVEPFVVGHIGSASNSIGGKQVIVSNMSSALMNSQSNESLKLNSTITKDNLKKVAVLISGSGTNLQALIDDSLKPDSVYQITLVLSNVHNAYGLQRAKQANIQTCVVSHKDYKSREDFDLEVNRILKEHGIDVVCLAGFMRILSDPFVESWKGRMLNVHPSLLPSFKGLHVHKRVLEAGVRISGCTVHFVSNELDGGAIVVQETVPVLPLDTEDELCERVKCAEHKAFPLALRLLTSGKVHLSDEGRTVWS